MTHEQLTLNGWRPELCKIDTLYFKDGYFCRLKDGKAIVFSVNDDMNPLGTAETFSEIRELQKNHELSVIQSLENTVKLLKMAFEAKYGE